jgi:hypothetical protein
MRIKISRDILVGCEILIKNYFTIQEFSGSKISSYDKAIYNALKLAIKGKSQDELFKKRQD